MAKDKAGSMKNKFFSVIFTVLFAIGCVSSKPSTPGGKRIAGKAGRTLPYIGISIDSNYDARLDHVLKGYKLLPVLIKNYSLKSIPMDVKNDRWVVIGEKGQKYTALNSLKTKDAAAWRRLPENIKNLIDYPEIIPIEYSVTFDLLLPTSTNLEYFKEIRFYSAPLQKEIIIEKEY